MKIEFIGPALLSVDGGIDYAAKVDDQDITCYFSYETLEDIDPDALMGEALELFAHHQLKLLSIAENKILKGQLHAGRLEIYSHDIG